MIKIKKIALFCVTFLCSMHVLADINPQATYTLNEVEVTDWVDISGDAPLRVSFVANPSSLDAGASLEWHLRNRTTGTNLTRYEENFEFIFTEAGVTVVSLIVIQDNEVVDSTGISITISDSHLEMPNAFSPNGDGVNDVYAAKSNYKSIVEFHAYIFNRYGQKLYDWTDITQGWDGTHNGSPVKDGVYFVYVKARGSDGREYEIKRDVNLIRDFNETMGNNNGE